MKHALILCSGGIDSVTTAYIAQKKNFTSLTFLFCAYGQLQEAHERRVVKYHARKVNAQYIEMNLTTLTNLTRKKMNGKKKHEHSLTNTEKESKQWFVPARNTVLIAHALAYIESHYTEKDTIWLYLGFKNEGKDSFSDTTSEYVKKMQTLLKTASYHRISLKVPLITKDKEEIIQRGTKLGLAYETTWSCYQPSQGKHCGMCLACRLRKAGFKWANISDPTQYARSFLQVV